MTAEQRQAIKTTIEYLDSLMEASPSRELASISNYLEGILEDN